MYSITAVTRFAVAIQFDHMVAGADGIAAQLRGIGQIISARFLGMDAFILAMVMPIAAAAEIDAWRAGAQGQIQPAAIAPVAILSL